MKYLRTYFEIIICCQQTDVCISTPCFIQIVEILTECDYKYWLRMKLPEREITIISQSFLLNEKGL